MRWGKRRKLLDELLYYFIVVNTDLYMTYVNKDKDIYKFFRNRVGALTDCMNKIVFNKMNPVNVQKAISKNTILKKEWTKVCEKMKSSSSVKEKGSVDENSADYFS